MLVSDANVSISIDCYHSGIGIHNCDHSDDASLRCQRISIDCYHSGIGIHNCDHSDGASLRCQRKYFNCHCIKTFVKGCGKILKLCAE